MFAGYHIGGDIFYSCSYNHLYITYIIYLFIYVSKLYMWFLITNIYIFKEKDIFALQCSPYDLDHKCRHQNNEKKIYQWIEEGGAPRTRIEEYQPLDQIVGAQVFLTGIKWTSLVGLKVKLKQGYSFKQLLTIKSLM